MDAVAETTAAIDIQDRSYRFTPEALSAEARDFMRSHGMDYSEPGQYGGIRQYESFCGVRYTVNVHPSFPAEITSSPSLGWYTSDREAALEFAATPNTPTDHPSHQYKWRQVERMVSAADAAAAFLAKHVDKGVVLRSDAYKVDVVAMFDAVAWDVAEDEKLTNASSGGLAWPDVWAKAMTLRFCDAPQYMIDRCAWLMACEMGSIIRRRAREGWLPMPTAMRLTDALEGAVTSPAAA